MSDEQAPAPPPPRRPGEERIVSWLRVGGVLLFALAYPVRWVVIDLLQPTYPTFLDWYNSGVPRAIEWSIVVAVLVGATLASAPRQVVRQPALAALLASFAVSFAMLGVHATWISPDLGGPREWEGDAALFFRMADDWPWRPGGWFRYRVAAPWLARLLTPAPPGLAGFTVPASTADIGYWRLALFSLTLTGPALSLLLRDLRFGAAARHLGVLLYLGSFALLYNSWNYALPDPLAMLILVLACRAIVRGRDAELAIWLLVGALTKEVVLFAVPVRWLWARREGLDLREALRTGLVALPALAAFALLRFTGDEAAVYAGFVTESAWLFPWKHQPDNVARLYSPFAAGWVLVAFSLRRPDRWTIAAAGFAVPCVLSLLVTDSGRMLVYLTPFAIPAMLRAVGAGERVSRRGLLAILLVCLSSRLWEPFLPLWAVPAQVRRPLALLLAVVCGWLAYRATASSTDASSPASAA